MKVTTSKSKNAESFYISKSFINDKGVSTSVNVRKLGLHKVCRKIRDKYNFKFDINSILSDLIYSRILEPSGKRSSYSCSMGFLEPPSYQLQIERGSTKKERRNPNNPARFLGIIAVTDDGEKANIHNYLNTEK